MEENAYQQQPLSSSMPKEEELVIHEDKSAIKTQEVVGQSKKIIIIPETEDNTPNKSKRFLYLILFINIFVAFGQNYVFDFPQSLESPLIALLKVDTVKISLLYAIYSLPNLIFTPITGYLIEKLGCAKSAVLYTFLVLIGQIVIFYGVEMGNYWWVLLGRGIFGIGGEGITILQLTINEVWFYGQFLSVSVAWCDVISVVGIMAGNYLNPVFFILSRSLSVSFFVSGVICFISAVFGLLYYFFHNKYIHRLEDLDSVDEGGSSGDVSRDFTINQNSNTNSKLIQEPRKEDFYEEHVRRKTIEDVFNEQKISFGFKSIQYFNSTYWILCVVFLFLANCYYQFTNIATEILENRYSYSYDEAHNLTIIPEAAFIVVSPFISVWIETKGKKPLWLFFASIIFLVNYVILYFMKPEKSIWHYVNFSWLGISYSIITCALFSSVALSIPKSGVSMGYSILTLVENLGLSSLPLYIGYITQERTVSSYNECLLILIILSILGTLSSLLLLVYDTNNTKLLTLPENSRKVKRLRIKIDTDFREKSSYMGSSFKEPNENYERKMDVNKDRPIVIYDGTSPKNNIQEKNRRSLSTIIP